MANCGKGPERLLQHRVYPALGLPARKGGWSWSLHLNACKSAGFFNETGWKMEEACDYAGFRSFFFLKSRKSSKRMHIRRNLLIWVVSRTKGCIFAGISVTG
ncbi:hypothetical protein BC351_28415 [Paenibacillus ferrarius]|uniref:Uncharacterized protein n=1 Tax=Paenibacillus ferrarius TaxID=1469647 RepID=A0A1V4HHZ6_9BACL|nr:hypothetical protein BC351_28415 [Paenibacillus ferrarius]